MALNKVLDANFHNFGLRVATHSLSASSAAHIKGMSFCQNFGCQWYHIFRHGRQTQTHCFILCIHKTPKSQHPEIECNN